MKTKNKVVKIGKVENQASRKIWMITCIREWTDLKEARTHGDIKFMRIIKLTLSLYP